MIKEAQEWLTKRGISQATWKQFSVVGGMAQFSELKESIIFQYFRGEERVNYKARSLVGKDFKQQTGGEQRFYNLDAVLGSETVWVVEGEMDALSLGETGFPVISVPGGAPATEGKVGARAYSFVESAIKEGLNAKRYVLAVDNDEPGRFLRQDLAAILGEGRCWFIDWPEGIKDANEALVAWGPDDLKIYLNDAQKSWPIDGLYRLSEIPEPPVFELWSPPWQEWGSKFMLAPTTFSVGTGYPKHGKTTLAQQMWGGVVKKYNFPVLTLSAETRVKPWVRMNLRMVYWNKSQSSMTEQEKKEADDWIETMFVFLGHPDANPTFPWVMDKIEAAVVRDGVRGVLLDPWNKLTDSYDNETRWVGQCLDTIAACVKGLNIHIQILAHPAKPGDPATRSKCPDPYSISGSAHWYNKPDQLFAIHRPVIIDDDGNYQREAVFHHQACRYEELGRPAQLPMRMGESGLFHASEFESKLEGKLKND